MVLPEIDKKCRICKRTTCIRAESGSGSTGWVNSSTRRGRERISRASYPSR